jgi:hypothetical protein
MRRKALDEGLAAKAWCAAGRCPRLRFMIRSPRSYDPPDFHGEVISLTSATPGPISAPSGTLDLHFQSGSPELAEPGRFRTNVNRFSACHHMVRAGGAANRPSDWLGLRNRRRSSDIGSRSPLAEQFAWTILALLRMLTHQGQIRTTNDQSSSVTSKEYLVTHKSQLVSAGDRASGARNEA